ncbi:MAG: response regulator [SAR324 cluster bacterium]|nr:response regulator [SAR324 cluster bacterium]
MKILLLDDKEMNNSLLMRFLNTQKFTDITCLTSGEKTLALLDNDKKKGQPFDVLFCDVIMPGGPDGFEMVKRIRASEKTRESSNPLHKAPKALIIISLTAMHSAKSEEKLMDLGADFFVTKPIEKLTLETLMKDVAKKLTKN